MAQPSDWEYEVHPAKEPDRKRYEVIGPGVDGWSMLIENVNNARQGGGSLECPLRYRLVAKYANFAECIEMAVALNREQANATTGR